MSNPIMKPRQSVTQRGSEKNSSKPLPADDLRRVVEQVGDAWKMFQGKYVVITGERGFVGRWMHESLAASKVGVQYNSVDGSEGDNVEEWWPEDRPDYIIHATTNGVGWQHVAAVARAARARILLLSSGAVYGGGQKRQFVEWQSLCADTDYGKEKREQEGRCRDIAVIARLFTFIGPGLRRHTGREFLEADPITVNDDGAVRSYLHASDMAAWLWRCLLLGKVGRAYNVGSGEAVKVTEFACKCADARHLPLLGRQSEQSGTYYVPDVSRAEQELRCRQTVGLDEAIRRTLAWQSK